MSWFFEKAGNIVQVTDEWDFYFLHVEDKPASIFVDLGRMKAIPDVGFEALVYLSLTMRQPRPDGFSSEEEFSVLSQIEEHVEAQAQKAGIIYVGRNTTDGKRDFYFYADEIERAVKVINAAMKAFPRYEYEADGWPDSDWSVYKTFLYPSPMDMQRILNHRVLEDLKKHGDDLALPRNIDHRAYFQNADLAVAFEARIRSAGYGIEAMQINDSQAKPFVDFFKLDKPQDIDDLVYKIIEMVAEYGGEYDGWGCTVVKEKDEQ